MFDPGDPEGRSRLTVDAESANYSDCAVTVLSTVVSTSVPGKAIIDAGSKTLSADALLSGEQKHFGYIQDHSELILEDLSEEHGHLAVREDSKIRVGETTAGDSESCVSLHQLA